MRDILLAELKKECDKATLTRREAMDIIELFEEGIEEGYSDEEALYHALDEIDSIKINK